MENGWAPFRVGKTTNRHGQPRECWRAAGSLAKPTVTVTGVKRLDTDAILHRAAETPTFKSLEHGVASRKSNAELSRERSRREAPT